MCACVHFTNTNTHYTYTNILHKHIKQTKDTSCACGSFVCPIELCCSIFVSRSGYEPWSPSSSFMETIRGSLPMQFVVVLFDCGFVCCNFGSLEHWCSNVVLCFLMFDGQICLL